MGNCCVFKQGGFMHVMKVVFGFLISGVVPMDYVNAAPPQSAAEYKAGKTNAQYSNAIREALVSEKYLSAAAQNVKIVVDKKSVILKGPVENEKEMEFVEAKARMIAPEKEIVNELQVLQ